MLGGVEMIHSTYLCSSTTVLVEMRSERPFCYHGHGFAAIYTVYEILGNEGLGRRDI